MITADAIVKFLELKNARGYPLTGLVLEANGEVATVQAWGLYGPGTNTVIKKIPCGELEVLPDNQQ